MITCDERLMKSRIMLQFWIEEELVHDVSEATHSFGGAP